MLLVAAAVSIAGGCGRFSFDIAASSDNDAAPADTVAPCTAPPAEHDEDKDGVDDACDVCPQIAGDQRDADNDGIGDACDLATTRQQRTFFDPFTAPRPDWIY